MAAGFSCGGVEATDNIWDSRVDTIGVISSSLLSNQTAAKDCKKPVLFVLGRTGDIAYQNVSSPSHQVLANGFHTDTNARASATSRTSQLAFRHGRVTFPWAMVALLVMRMTGTFGKAILNQMLYTMKNNTQAASYFTNGYKADNWQVQTHDLNLLTPLICKQQALRRNTWVWIGPVNI